MSTTAPRFLQHSQWGTDSGIHVWSRVSRHKKIRFSHNTDVPCAVCYVPIRNSLYIIPAKYTCPSGWTREYFGYLMSEHHSHYQSQFSCVDHSLTPVTGSIYSHNGFLFYTVEGVCGSLPCPPYS